MDEKNLNIEKLKFIKKLALEYRLSMKNICRLLGKEPTEENIQYYYNLFMSDYKILKFDERKKFVYLDYETTGEKTSREKAMYTLAQQMFLKRQEALMTGDEELIKQINNRIKKIDIDFDNLGERKRWINVTDEEILVIAKYRIKHAKSKREINYLLGIGDETLTRYERQISSEFWSSKIKKLNEYNFSVCHTFVNERRKNRK